MLKDKRYFLILLHALTLEVKQLFAEEDIELTINQQFLIFDFKRMVLYLRSTLKIRDEAVVGSRNSFTAHLDNNLREPYSLRTTPVRCKTHRTRAGQRARISP